MKQALSNSPSRLFAVMCAVISLLVSLPGHARNLDEIIVSGTLLVGVKKDVPLWGYQDPKSGDISGMEVDLAMDLASRIGVKLKTVGLRSDERIDAIRSGRVDVLIATLSDTPARREHLALVSPHYYSSGVNLLARKSDYFREWRQLKNRKVCGRRGSFYNRLVTVTYGMDIVALHSLDWATSAFLDGRCSALIYDDTAIVAMLKSPPWSHAFEMPMKTLYPTPWAIAIAKEEAGSPLGKIISTTIATWHREGLLVQLERKWGIPPSLFVGNMHSIWRQKLQSGEWYCNADISQTTPVDCLTPATALPK